MPWLIFTMPWEEGGIRAKPNSPLTYSFSESLILKRNGQVGKIPNLSVLVVRTGIEPVLPE